MKVMGAMEGAGEPSLAETAIGEDDESSLQGSPVAAGHGAFVGPAAAFTPKPVATKPVHRSLSDRYSYRAAIFNSTETKEYDII